MAITSTQQTDILKVVAGLFNAAPGGTNLNDLAKAVEGGMTIKQLANVLASNTLFTNGIMAGKVTTDAQAAVLMNNFGLVADDTTTSAGSQALAYFKAQIDAKVGFGDIVFDAVTFLSGSSVPAEFTTAATLLANKALVAASYSASTSSSDLSVLQNVVKTVTGTAPFTAADVATALASGSDTTAPVVTAPTAAIEYNENQAAGATLATIAATDNVSVASFQIASGDTSGFFAIDSTGKISLTEAGLKSSANDFETTPNTVTLGITATDNAGNKSTSVNVTLNVKDVDDVAPTVKSAVINGTTATISFSEALSTTAATPAIADFAVGIKGGSGSIGVNAVQVTGSTVVLTLGRAPVTGETFTVAYTQGTNALQDVAGNKAASFANQDVTVDTTAPAITAGQTFTFVEAISDGKGGLTGPVTKTTDVIGTVAATDNTGVTSFAITAGNDKGWFAIDSVGKLTLTTAGLTAASNDFETTPNSFSLSITAKDGAGNTSTVGTVAVNVTNNTADDPAVGATFTLTTGIDTVSGTSSTINGIISDTTTDQTWALTDSITGTTGTTDILNARIIGDANGVSRTGLQTSAVETISFNYTDANDAAETNTISASGFTGITKLAVTGSSNVNTTSTVRDTVAFTSVATGVALELGSNTAQTSVTLTNTGTAATGDAINLNTVGGSSGVVTLRDANTTEGFVTVNIATSGSTASTLKSLDAGTSNTTVNVTGDQAVTITDALSSTVKTLDASKASGAVTAGVVAASTLVAKGGTAITDKLTVTVDSTFNTGPAISGFETVALDTTGTGTLSYSLLTGATAVNVASTASAVGTVLTLTDAVAQGVNFVGDKNTTADQFFDGVTQQLKTNGSSDSVAVTINNGATTTTKTATIGAVNLSVYESATITSGDFKTATTGTLTLAAAATSLAINAATDLVVGGVASASLAAINASGSVGNVSLGTLTATAALTYTGSQGVDTLTTTTGSTALQTFNLGTGDDVITVSTAGAGLYQLNGEAGNDLFKFTEAPAADTIGVDGGAGTADSVTAAATGAAMVFDTWVNIEKFQDNTNQAVTFTVASGYAEAMEITTINTTGVTTFTAANASSTVDLSKLTFTGAAFGAVTQLVLSTNNGTNTLTGAATQATTINGGTGADTITGGTGADALNGGAGADSITAGAGADTITGGTGIDTIFLGAAGDVDTLKYSESGATNVDTVSVAGTNIFTVGTDIISFSIGAIDNNGTNQTLSNMVGADISGALAAGAFTSQSVAANGSAALADTTDLIVFTTAATTFAGAIGTAVLTATTGTNTAGLSSTEGVAAVWFDSANNQSVYGYIVDSTANGTALTSADTFVEIVRVGQSSQPSAANLDLSLSAF